MTRWCTLCSAILLLASCRNATWNPTSPGDPLGGWIGSHEHLDTFRLAISGSGRDSLLSPNFGPDAPIRNLWSGLAGTDSLMIFPNAGGFGGHEVRFLVRNDSIVGEIRAWEDVASGPFPSSPFTATRARCPGSLAGSG